jgi:hypothetical protein
MTYWEQKAERSAAFLRAVHGIEEPTPDPEGQPKVNFDGGVRQSAPPESDPLADHNLFGLA